MIRYFTIYSTSTALENVFDDAIQYLIDNGILAPDEIESILEAELTGEDTYSVRVSYT